MGYKILNSLPKFDTVYKLFHIPNPQIKVGISTSSCLEISYRKKDVPKCKNPFIYHRRNGKGKLKRIDYRIIQEGAVHNVPYDLKDAYFISPKEVHPSKLGGSLEVMKRIGNDTERYGHPPGYFDEDGQFVLVPEMIPQFIVPDLAEFQLKPYVSYNMEEVKTEELTPKELFMATYGSVLMKKRAQMSGAEIDRYVAEFVKRAREGERAQVVELQETVAPAAEKVEAGASAVDQHQQPQQPQKGA